VLRFTLSLATAVVAVLAVLVSGAAARPAQSGFPVTITTPAGKVTISKKPTRIVSLSPTATETLFAVGAGSQVVAVDDQSDYPKAAPKTSLSGFTPNVEAIASYRPDLVVIAYDPQHAPRRAVSPCTTS
jgi:iron complex transport system substrate-binding protein